MRFSKTIFCDDEKIEITAETCIMIDQEKTKDISANKRITSQKDTFDVYEFLATYGNNPDVAKMARLINTTVTEIPFQVDLWREFCSVLVKSANAGFLGVEYSECLPMICKGVVCDCLMTQWNRRTTDTANIESNPFNPLDFYGGHDKDCYVSVREEFKYNKCRNIKLENNDHIVVKVKYTSILDWEVEKYSLNYPLDYLGLLENMESYIAEKTAPRRGLSQILLKKEPKAPALPKGDQMIKDFLNTNGKEIQRFKIYAQRVKNVESQKVKAKEMYQNFRREGALIIDNKGFPQERCKFDIFKKKEEIDSIVKKLQNSIDAGEEEVEYAIRWLCAESAFHFKAIKKNCETKYRYGCILLKNPGFIDEQQEYDHILVSDGGIILIETKNWKGKVEIRSDGKWVRDSENNGCLVGVESPLYQIQRHEALIKSILPNVAIYSLLVFSNSSLMLEGRENCNMCRVIYVDQLKETVMNILSSSELNGRAIDYCVNEIEKYKINIMGDDVKELK